MSNLIDEEIFTKYKYANPNHDPFISISIIYLILA